MARETRVAAAQHVEWRPERTVGLFRPARASSTFRMSIFDLVKATLTCGISAFLIYTFPVLSQAMIIGLLTLLWLSYAHRTFCRLLRR